MLTQNGLNLIARIFKSKKSTSSLNDLRFDNSCTPAVKSTCSLEKIPPTEGAARQHCFRRFYQVQTWTGNKLKASDGDWKQTEDGMMPMLADEELIPDVLLKTISCNCETGYVFKRCDCRQHGLKCKYQFMYKLPRFRIMFQNWKRSCPQIEWVRRSDEEPVTTIILWFLNNFFLFFKPRHFIYPVNDL